MERNWFVDVLCLTGPMLLVSGSLAATGTSTLSLDEQGVQHATIIMDSYSYSPNDLTVHAGKPVEFMFRNTATFTPHTFVVDDPATGLYLRAEVNAGETQTVRFTPLQSGNVTFYCDKKLLFFKSHRERGQEGHLEIR
jgi:plastocyanin